MNAPFLIISFQGPSYRISEQKSPPEMSCSNLFSRFTHGDNQCHSVKENNWNPNLVVLRFRETACYLIKRCWRCPRVSGPCGSQRAFPPGNHLFFPLWFPCADPVSVPWAQGSLPPASSSLHTPISEAQHLPNLWRPRLITTRIQWKENLLIFKQLC